MLCSILPAPAVTFVIPAVHLARQQYTAKKWPACGLQAHTTHSHSSEQKPPQPQKLTPEQIKSVPNDTATLRACLAGSAAMRDFLEQGSSTYEPAGDVGFLKGLVRDANASVRRAVEDMVNLPGPRPESRKLLHAQHGQQSWSQAAA